MLDAVLAAAEEIVGGALDPDADLAAAGIASLDVVRFVARLAATTLVERFDTEFNPDS